MPSSLRWLRRCCSGGKYRLEIIFSRQLLLVYGLIRFTADCPTIYKRRFRGLATILFVWHYTFLVFIIFSFFFNLMLYKNLVRGASTREWEDTADAKRRRTWPTAKTQICKYTNNKYTNTHCTQTNTKSSAYIWNGHLAEPPLAVHSKAV